LVIVAVPSAAQVAAAVLIVGTGGVINCAAMLKEALDAEEHAPSLAITVYEVPIVIPEMIPPAPAVGPAGVKMYV
jgi:hypothetical protein